MHTTLIGRTVLGTAAAITIAASLTACGDPDEGVEPTAPEGAAFASSPEDGESVPAPENALAPDGVGDTSSSSDTSSLPTVADPQMSPMASSPTLPAGCVRVNLKSTAGAKGNGVTNDTAAFQKAAALIKAAGCGELIIPPATYIVGKQIEKTSSTAPGPFYDDQPIFTISGVSFLKISAYGAKIRVASGLHYGGFNPKTGQPMDSTGATNERASVGRIFDIEDSDNVWIEGGELDGNNTKLVLGGQSGNEDRQASGTGIVLHRCLKATVVDVHTHHHALDGITISHHKYAAPAKRPQRLIRVKSEYNGRQALSWIGGWGLEAIDCKFNHTGRAVNQGGGVDSGLPLVSKPAAGLDIEPNAGTNEKSRDGVFTRCEFVNNTAAGLIAALGDGGYSTFNDCTFWGTTSYSIWADRPGLKFIKSRFYGTATKAHDGRAEGSTTPNPALATYFEGCTFEDKPWTNGQVYRANNLYTVSDTEDSSGTVWKRCTFINHAVRAVNIGGASSRELFDSCTFVHSNGALPSGTHQSRFSGSQLRSCLFKESSAISGGTKKYYVDTNNVSVLSPLSGSRPTHVDGPRVRWDSTSGRIGDIPAGTY